MWPHPCVWTQAGRALAVYREAVSDGYVPRLHVLDRLLGCLRTQRPESLDRAIVAAPFQVNSGCERPLCVCSGIWGMILTGARLSASCAHSRVFVL